MKKNDSNLPSNAEVNQFLMLRELVTGLYDEMKDFAKKSANETLNEFKIKSLNRVLTPLKVLMKDQPTALFLDVLDESSLPTNSDVVIILSQYLTAMQNYEDFNMNGSDKESKEPLTNDVSARTSSPHTEQNKKEETPSMDVVKYCRHCGKKVDYDSSTYCKYCGKEL